MAEDPYSAEKTQAQKVAQSLIQYAPLGGNLFIFGSLTLSKSWLEAVVAGVILVPTVIWAKFSEGFLEEFGIASTRWGQNTGKALSQALELSVLQRLSGLEDKYIRAQGLKCQELEIDGFQLSDEHCIPLLEQVFVPLRLHRNFYQNQNRDEIGELLPNKPGYGLEYENFDPSRIYAIWEFLKEKRKQTGKADRIAIKAYGGYGKTTLLRHVAYAFMSGEYQRQGYKVPKLLPVLIYLRNGQTVLGQEDAPDLATFIHEYHLPSLSKQKDLQALFPVDWLDFQLRKGKMLVMIDGFDEVRKEQRQKVSRWIGEQMREYFSTTFLVTSRPKAYDQDFVRKSQCNLTMAVDKFSIEQQQDFIEKWYRAQEIKVRRGRRNETVIDLAAANAANLWQQFEARPELQALAKNPLMLNMMVSIHRSTKGQALPDRKAELYQKIFTLQLGDRITTRGLPLMLPAVESQKILQGVAFAMFLLPNMTQIDKANLLQLLRENLMLAELDDRENFDLEAWLFQLEHRSELIVKLDDLYQFAHKSFQEFLAAKYVKDYHQETELLKGWRRDAEWEGTVLLYATLVNPTQLIEILFNTGEERDRILASKCLDITPRKVPQFLRDKLAQLDDIKIHLRYQKLEEYLKNQQFKDADQETYRVMCEVLNQEENNRFEPNDLRKFPCADLKKIDDLWMKYSQGKFGFAIQKKIWETCGSPMAYNHDWEKFGQTVGWLVKNDFLKYDNYNFTMEAFDGHLPSFRCHQVNWSLRREYTTSIVLARDYMSSLFSRQDLHTMGWVERPINS